MKLEVGYRKVLYSCTRRIALHMLMNGGGTAGRLDGLAEIQIAPAAACRLSASHKTIVCLLLSKMILSSSLTSNFLSIQGRHSGSRKMAFADSG